jgi:hypothetical protein
MIPPDVTRQGCTAGVETRVLGPIEDDCAVSVGRFGTRQPDPASSLIDTEGLRARRQQQLLLFKHTISNHTTVRDWL